MVHDSPSCWLIHLTNKIPPLSSAPIRDCLFPIGAASGRAANLYIQLILWNTLSLLCVINTPVSRLMTGTDSRPRNVVLFVLCFRLYIFCLSLLDFCRFLLFSYVVVSPVVLLFGFADLAGFHRLYFVFCGHL